MQEILFNIYDDYKNIFNDQNKSLILELNNLPLPHIQSGKKLKEILILFLENAKRYTFVGCKVILGAKMVNQKVYLYVSDNGIGMDEKKAGPLLEKYQTESKKKEGRHILSLPVLKNMAGDPDIRLIVISQKEFGNEFGLLFPA